ncbi:hypothetical protein ACQPYK_30980 [Streptosporangium sp. CA-135522]|uniref:hypothetical protein n=1 Tax=Streptosporangium sp. CA-135522 TaxID=3240072 RepID=UPI003D8CE4F7
MADRPLRLGARGWDNQLWRLGDDLAAAWILLPDGTADRFHDAYQPAPDAATLRRARGWAVGRALSGILIGEAGVRGRPGGKATWGPPAHAALRRLIATAHR